MRVLPYKDLKAAKGIPYSEEWIRNLVKTGKFPKRFAWGKNVSASLRPKSTAG
jgi:hypothetical protein